MGEGSGYDLNNILTGLLTRVGQLDGAVKTFMENWAQQDKLAHESRRVVFDRLDLLGRQVDRIASDLEDVQQNLAGLKREFDEEAMPMVKAFQGELQRRIGAKGVWGIIIGAAITLGGFVTWLTDRVITHVWPKG